MTRKTQNTPHVAAQSHAAEYAAGKLNRREFLARSTALGVTAAAAYGLIGLTQPVSAQEAKMGGTVRIQMSIRSPKDPRTYDWPELGNQTRGWLEYLVKYERDGSFAPMLLESWEANEDATEYVLNVRKGVTWHNGEAFTSADVARNIAMWADSTVEGNSMAARMAALADDAGKIRSDAIEIMGDHQLKLVLSRPDISIISSFADYPAAVTHSSHTDNPTVNPMGTGPYTLLEFEVGVKATIVKAEGHNWWGGDAPLDRIEYLDYGTEPSAIVSAIESDEIDVVYETTGEYVALVAELGWDQSEAITASTIVIRPNHLAEHNGKTPFADINVRRAIQLAVNNAVAMELGYADRGEVAENHHVCPVHPEYAKMPEIRHDPAEAKRLIDEAGLADYEFELISSDGGWTMDTADAVAAQIRDAGINIRRKLLPGATFWNDWTKYPFSATTWGHRALGVEVLNLAYRSGAAWNETAFANDEFDKALDLAMSIADVDERRKQMMRLQEIMQEQAVTVQPFWRKLYKHTANYVRNAEMHPTHEVRPSEIWIDA